MTEVIEVAEAIVNKMSEATEASEVTEATQVTEAIVTEMSEALVTDAMTTAMTATTGRLEHGLAMSTWQRSVKTSWIPFKRGFWAS